MITLVQVYHGLQGSGDIYSQFFYFIFLLHKVSFSESESIDQSNTYRSYSEGDDVLAVTLLQHNQPAVLLIRPVPAVDYLVAPPGDVDALPVTACELLLPTPGELEGGGVRQPVVAGRTVALYQPAGPPQHQGVKPSVRPPHRPLILTPHAQLPQVGCVVEADLRAGDADIDQLGGVGVPGYPVGVDVGLRAETSQGEVDLLPPLADAVNDVAMNVWRPRAFPIEPARSPISLNVNFRLRAYYPYYTIFFF